MTVLVTGAGLIGRLTAERLGARGDAVVLADVRPPPPVAGDVTAVVADVTDFAALEAIVRTHGVTGIVHTAAMLSTGIRQDPRRGVEVNVLGTANVLEVARQSGVARVVVASSTTVTYSVFGSLGPEPIGEDVRMAVVSERPGSIYAATKLAGEHLALVYHDLYGLDTVVLRYGAVIGSDGGPSTSVPGRLLDGLIAAGRSGRTMVLDDPYLVWGGEEEFVDARDCADANVAALDASRPQARVYTIATGRTVTLAGFVDAVRAVLPDLAVECGPEPATGFAGFRHRRPAPSSPEAAARELDFRCRHDLTSTIRWTAFGRAQPT